MDVFTAISARRSVKKFDPGHVMTEDEITRLMEAVILSPTSFNMQNWRFVLVTDPELKREIRAAGWDQAQFSDCSLLVILAADLHAYARQPERYWANADSGTQQAIVGMMKAFYGDNEAARHDEALRSGGLAATTLMLAAQAMGYDTCPMVGFDMAKTGALINLPADHEIVMAVAVGKRTADPAARGGQLPLDEVIVRDRF